MLALVTGSCLLGPPHTDKLRFWATEELLSSWHQQESWGDHRLRVWKMLTFPLMGHGRTSHGAKSGVPSHKAQVLVPEGEEKAISADLNNPWLL